MKRKIIVFFFSLFFFLPFTVKADILQTNPLLSSDWYTPPSFLVDKPQEGQPVQPNTEADVSDFAERLKEQAEKQKQAEEQRKKQEAEQNAFSYANYKDKMEKLTSYVYFKDDLFGFGTETNYLFNSLVQGVFWLAKLFFSIFAGIIGAVEKLTDISSMLNSVVGYADKVFTVIFSDDIKKLLGFSFVFYLLLVFARGGQSVVRTFVKLLLTFTLITSYFQQFSIGESGNKYLIVHVYEGVKGLGESIATSTSKAIQSADSSMTETYFTTSVLTSFKNLNSPKDDKGNYLLSEAEFQDLTKYRQGKGEDKVVDVKIEELAKEDNKKGAYLLAVWGTKFNVALTANFDSVFLGIIYTFLSLGQAFFLFAFAFLVLLLPFFMIIGLFPTLGGYLTGFTKKALTFLLYSVAFSIVAVVFSIVYNIFSNMIESATGGANLVSTIIKIIMIVLFWKQRHQLSSLAGGISRHLPKMPNRQTFKNAKDRIAKTKTFNKVATTAKDHGSYYKGKASDKLSKFKDRRAERQTSFNKWNQNRLTKKNARKADKLSRLSSQATNKLDRERLETKSENYKKKAKYHNHRRHSATGGKVMKVAIPKTETQPRENLKAGILPKNKIQAIRKQNKKTVSLKDLKSRKQANEKIIQPQQKSQPKSQLQTDVKPKIAKSKAVKTDKNSPRKVATEKLSKVQQMRNRKRQGRKL